MNSLKMHRKGFTLIEMLIVIAIIGILATLVLVGLGPVQQQGRDARRLSDLKQVQNGLELYFSKCGTYPGGASSVAGCTTGAPADWAALQNDLTGAGIGVNQVPADPTASKTYYYVTDANYTTYVLAALFENTTNPAMSQSLTAAQFNSTGATLWHPASPGTCGAVGLYCISI